MKKLEIIIRPEKLEDLKAILEESNVNGLNIANIMGYGNQKGVVKRYRGAEYRVNLLPKIKVETVVSDEVSEALIDKIVIPVTMVMVRFSFMMFRTLSESVQASVDRRLCSFFPIAVFHKCAAIRRFYINN